MAGGILAITFTSRALARIKIERRTRRDAELPLFSAVALEIATTPRESADDADVMAEIRATLTHLNRRRYADEARRLPVQLKEYTGNLPLPLRPTVNHVAVRLIESHDPWLAVIGAGTAAELAASEAIPSIDRAIAAGSGEMEPALQDARATLVAASGAERG